MSSLHPSLLLISDDIAKDYSEFASYEKEGSSSIPSFEVFVERQLKRRVDLGDISQHEADEIFDHLLKSLA